MVVVLIIGILATVGLPTFLGARDRGADAAALTRLRVAADTAYSLSNFGTDFSQATTGALDLAEPWIDFVGGTQASTDPDTVSVDSSQPSVWSAVVLSGSDRCLGVIMNASGRSYFESASCAGGTAAQQPAVTPAIDGGATFEGATPEDTDFAPNRGYRSDDEFFVFFESSLILDANLTVAGVTIPAGTFVCSYLVWYDPASSRASSSATIDFGNPVLVGAGRTSELQATDQFAAPGVDYFNYNRPWYDGDTFSFSGSEGYFTAIAIRNNADMIRILTDCG